MSKRTKVKTLFLEYSDLAKIWDIKSMRLAMLGVLALPLMYSFIYLWAFFDPYENIKYLPVAVVNEDVGVHTSEHDLEIGKELVEELQGNSKVKWDFVSRTQMDQGFKEGTYALAVIIPKDFSEKALTVDSPKPLQNMIEYRSDPSQNYLTSRMGNSIIQGLKADLGNQLTKGFLEEVFAGIRESKEKLQEAADGAQSLADGAKKAKDGANTIVSKTKLLQDGANRVAEGNRILATKLQQEVQKLQEKLAKLPVSWNEVKALQTKIHDINKQIQEAAKKPSNQTVDLADMKNRLEESRRLQLQANQTLDTILKEHPELSSEENIKKLKDTLFTLQQRSEGNQEQVNLLAKDLGNTSTLPSLQEFASYSQQLTNHIDQTIREIETANRKLQEVVSGTQQLAKGSSQVAEGISKLQDGQRQLANGLGKIDNGSHRLASGLQDGVDKAEEALVSENEKESVMSDPVQVKEEEMHKVPNYATGFAPYFLSLSLWVGAMILFTIFDIFQFQSKIAHRPVRLSMVSLVGMLQAIITSAALTIGLGIQVELPIWLYVFTMLMGVTFIALNQMLVTYFGNVGRFLAILILMLQLASSGGTYPIELSPELIQMIHPYLPMSYTVHGLRAVLSSGNEIAVYHDSLILLGYFTVAVILTQLGGRYLIPAIKKKKKSNTVQSNELVVG